jgi:hypothetical protein
MKSLKITLMIVAVFCLTISGTSKQTETEPTLDIVKTLDKSEFKYIASVNKKDKKPTQEETL